ncbi:hypothetical protein VC83_09042 [Pseudogymnoascus destructans]|uniref:Uncharacterized protein n=1 Tax=Pseudogymnoascus destructans TaxID=655981 RepID=A0A177A0W0_9PEZI|nr:uncharacterized protein VC83_09042 [Pseudogymnoascus destructans]OAF54584.1 hypothetical protein VC83_09042 [Pseudogymnoascus destructans]
MGKVAYYISALSSLAIRALLDLRLDCAVLSSHPCSANRDAVPAPRGITFMGGSIWEFHICGLTHRASGLSKALPWAKCKEVVTGSVPGVYRLSLARLTAHFLRQEKNRVLRLTRCHLRRQYPSAPLSGLANSADRQPSTSKNQRQPNTLKTTTTTPPTPQPPPKQPLSLFPHPAPHPPLATASLAPSHPGPPPRAPAGPPSCPPPIPAVDEPAPPPASWPISHFSSSPTSPFNPPPTTANPRLPAPSSQPPYPTPPRRRAPSLVPLQRFRACAPAPATGPAHAAACSKRSGLRGCGIRVIARRACVG